jgi:hypothetical protein
MITNTDGMANNKKVFIFFSFYRVIIAFRFLRSESENPSLTFHAAKLSNMLGTQQKGQRQPRRLSWPTFKQAPQGRVAS